MNLLAQQILQLLPEAGDVSNALPNTVFFRVDEPHPLKPLIYQPSIYFVAQGEKEAWLGDQRFVYNELAYLVLTVPLPLRCRVFTASTNHPFLAVRLNINLPVLNDLLTQLPEPNNLADESKSGIFITHSNQELIDSVNRYVGTLEQPEKISVLAPIYYREILFHLLQGEQANVLRNFAIIDRQSNRIAQAIQHIHRHYAQALRVEELADIAAMSPSTFYEHFKNVTQHSPLQYLKNIRLHQAKNHIFADQLPINEAAYKVGYESPSQFSREYKRLFGHSPMQHLQQR